MERLAKARYPNGVASRSRVLNEVVVKCLRGIESELDSRARVAKLKSFVFLNRVRAFESPQGYQLVFAENCAIVELLK